MKAPRYSGLRPDHPAVLIAQREGITVRRAYDRMRRADLANTTTDVPENIKLKILSTLSRQVRSVTAKELVFGLGTDLHNLQHVLWVLQKQRLVRFRVKRNGTTQDIYGLWITEAGREYLAKGIAEKQSRRAEAEAIAAQIQAQKTTPSTPPSTTPSTPPSTKPDTTPAKTEETKVAPMVTKTTPVTPFIEKVSVRASKIEMAAKLLDEAGEPETAALARGQVAALITPADIETLWSEALALYMWVKG